MTELPYLISDEALADVTGIAIWYETKRLFLSNQFLQEFYTVSLKAICSSSKSFRKANKNSSIRRYKMNRFPYKIFYNNQTLPIKIIAVIHVSRSSRYIKRRLK